ncbi:inner nuclear membrane protein enriched at telomere/subtelomere region [Arthrobotrys musiformis]|uniref:Inner nuclear membrane protein enriched at telomere/subtelomere region n=1 Tax=Arthrobotrys musiformis TaxID=47236 RepID=A0AAV9WFP7_9PEZI
MDDETYYLQPGFDASSLTMPVIRNLLLKHEIDFPSNVKKAKLVEIFETELAPQAPRLLAEAGRVRASARGIVNAEDYGTIGEPEVGRTPKKRAPRRKASSVATTTTDYDETTGDEDIVATVRKATRKVATPRKRTASPVKRGRKSSAMVQQETDDDEGATIVVEETPRARRGVRRSLAPKTPEPVKQPSPSPPPEHVAAVDDEPVFSNENPFQMGSSPRYQQPVDTNRRRTMLDKATPRQVDSSRRRTEGLPSVRRSPQTPEFDRVSPLPNLSPTPVKMIPMSKFKSLTPDRKSIANMQAEIDSNNNEIERRIFGNNEVYIKEEDQSLDMLEPGEEFTPEEQLEVELEDENANAVTKLARRKGQSELGTTLMSILTTLFSIAIVAYAAWWREEKIKVGYCGIGKPAIRNTGYLEWADKIVPQCETCPSHAVCRDRLSTECYTDYVLVPHPFSLGGLIPLAPTCQPDSEKIRRVSVLSEAVITKLRDRAAAIECGYIKATSEEEQGISEKDIKDALYEMKSPTLSDDQFNELWFNAVQDLENKDEVVTTMTSGGDRYFKSTDLSNVNWTCAIRKNTLALLFRWKLEIFGVITLILASLKIRSSMLRRQVYARQVQRLVGIALKRLAQQQRAYYNDRTADIAYLPVNQLRDQILSREFDPEKRQTLWTGVAKVVEMNSNVRTTSIEHMGEIMRCWTWIGSSALLDMDAGDGESGSQKDEAELRAIMGGEEEKKELVRPREELTPRILY